MHGLSSQETSCEGSSLCVLELFLEDRFLCTCEGIHDKNADHMECLNCQLLHWGQDWTKFGAAHFPAFWKNLILQNRLILVLKNDFAGFRNSIAVTKNEWNEDCGTVFKYGP